MPPVNDTIPTLNQGVSQQASKQRRSIYAEEQTNGLSDPTLQLVKRPGTFHIASAPDFGNERAFFHWIDRPGGERYVIGMLDRVVKVWTAGGDEVTVLDPNGAAAYLETDTPRQSIRAFTEADTTFLVNREKVVLLTGSTTPTLPNDGLIYIRQGAYSAEYGVRVRTAGGAGTAYSVTTADGTTDATVSNTDTIAAALASELDSGFTSATITHTAGQSLIRVQDSSAFFLEGFDSSGGTLLTATKDSLSTFSDLPPKAPDGFRVKIGGLEDSSSDDYWVSFRSDDDGFYASEGVWEETVAPGINDQILSTSMPIQIVRKVDDALGTATGAANSIYFEISRIEWGRRAVGDEDTNELPSFVGNRIDNVFVYNNRLGFLSGSNLILSRADDLFQFFRTTVRSLPDDERIDVRLNPAKADSMRYVLPTTGELLLVGANAQVSIPEDAPTTPSGIRVGQSSSLGLQINTPPILAGRSALLPTYSGEGFSGVLEYRANRQARLNDASPLTAAVPRYIPGEIRHMAASTDPSMLFVSSTTKPASLFVFRWMDVNNERVLSSWSEWTFSADRVLSFNVYDGTLVILFERDGDMFFESLALDSEAAPPGFESPLRLDRLSVGASPPLGIVTPDQTPLDTTIDTIAGSIVEFQPAAAGSCFDASGGFTVTYTLTTTTLFTEVETFTFSTNSTTSQWITDYGSPDIAYQGSLRVTLTNTNNPGSPGEVTFNNVLLMGYTGTGRWILSTSKSGETWGVPQALVWYSAGLSRDIQVTPLQLDGTLSNFDIIGGGGFYLLPLDEAQDIMDSADADDYQMLNDIGASGGTLFRSINPYVPADASDPACDPASVLTTNVSIT